MCSWKVCKIRMKRPVSETPVFFNRPDACNFIKKETLAQVFPVNFAKFLRTPFLQNTRVAAFTLNNLNIL